MEPKQSEPTRNRSPFSPFLAKRAAVVLDGGLATELERAGHDLDDPLWSARALLNDPDAVRAVHRAYLAAGADCILTATYQATIPGLAARGMRTADAEQVLLRAVRLAVQARDEFWASGANRQGRLRPLVAASVGPYGAFLADGSEYRGRYGAGRDALVRFHRRRWEVLASSEADLIACETIPSMAEVEALAELAREAGGLPAWLSFSCRDETSLCDGTPVAEAAAVAHAADGVFAVGVNCVAPEHVPALVAALAARTDKPVVAYPNAGGAYDAQTKRWTGRSPRAAGASHPARGWVDAGASAVGGCCRTGPEEIVRIRAAVGACPMPPAPAAPVPLADDDRDRVAHGRIERHVHAVRHDGDDSVLARRQVLERELGLAETHVVMDAQVVRDRRRPVHVGVHDQVVVAGAGLHRPGGSDHKSFHFHRHPHRAFVEGRAVRRLGDEDARLGARFGRVSAALVFGRVGPPVAADRERQDRGRGNRRSNHASRAPVIDH